MDRRSLLKAFGGAAALPAVQSVEILELRPKDSIVLKCRGCLSEHSHASIRLYMERYFPGRTVLILEEGMDIEVLRAGK